MENFNLDTWELFNSLNVFVRTDWSIKYYRKSEGLPVLHVRCTVSNFNVFNSLFERKELSVSELPAIPFIIEIFKIKFPELVIGEKLSLESFYTGLQISDENNPSFGKGEVIQIINDYIRVNYKHTIGKIWYESEKTDTLLRMT